MQRPQPRRYWQHVVLLAAIIKCVAFGAATASQPGQQDQIRLVALGDSLTAGYKLAPEEAFPARLETALRARGHNVRVENAGVSGDTTSGGLERLAWAVPSGTDAVIVELGANDAMRGVDPAQVRKNLERMLEELRGRDIEVLIAGMRAPRNLGETYAKQFDPIFAELAKAHDAVLYPFFLEGVALDPRLNQVDGIHPNAKGIDAIVERILPSVEELLKRAKKRRLSKT